MNKCINKTKFRGFPLMGGTRHSHRGWWILSAVSSREAGNSVKAVCGGPGRSRDPEQVESPETQATGPAGAIQEAGVVMDTFSAEFQLCRIRSVPAQRWCHEVECVREEKRQDVDQVMTAINHNSQAPRCLQRPEQLVSHGGSNR